MQASETKLSDTCYQAEDRSQLREEFFLLPRSSLLSAGPVTVGVSLEDSTLFQEREDALAQLQGWLLDRPKPHRMLLHGLGGSGKTTLARVAAARAAAGPGAFHAILVLRVSKLAEDYRSAAVALQAALGEAGGKVSKEVLKMSDAEVRSLTTHALDHIPTT